MWKAWLCRAPLFHVMLKSAASGRRGLAETTAPLSQQAAAAIASRTDARSRLAPSGKAKFAVMDGNEAAAYVAYAMSDISFIYPISPATSMGEHMDKWAATGKKNILGQVS